MTVIPIIRVSSLCNAIRFYTQTLDFELSEGDAEQTDPGFATLKRGESYAFLSSFGDGLIGHAVVVAVPDLDVQIAKLRSRGLVTPDPGTTESPVHEGAVDQTWGNREFYVDDPDRNTIRFVQFR